MSLRKQFEKEKNCKLVIAEDKIINNTGVNIKMGFNYILWLEKQYKQLLKYAQHKGECEKIQGIFGKDGFWHDSKKCTCGYNKLLKENK